MAVSRRFVFCLSHFRLFIIQGLPYTISDNNAMQQRYIRTTLFWMRFVFVVVFLHVLLNHFVLRFYHFRFYLSSINFDKSKLTAITKKNSISIGWKLTFYGFWYKVQSTILATDVLIGAIDPDVSGLDFILWQFQRQIAIQHFFVDQCIWWWF